MRLVLLVAVLMPLAAAVAAPPETSVRPPGKPVDRRVLVGGRTYRVTTWGDRVEVASKGMLLSRTDAMLGELRQAVPDATGCRIVDDRWVGRMIRGRLDCAGATPR